MWCLGNQDFYQQEESLIFHLCKLLLCVSSLCYCSKVAMKRIIVATWLLLVVIARIMKQELLFYQCYL
jgi:hypothetical protein